MRRSVRVVGLGEVEVAAYGFNDAEHRVEKEISELWPDAAVSITAVRRSDGPARIVDEFVVSYKLEAVLDTEEKSYDTALREAFRRARSHFEGTRYRHLELRAPTSKTD